MTATTDRAEPSAAEPPVAPSAKAGPPKDESPVQRSVRKIRAFLPLAADILVPVLGYFVLAAAGLPDSWALSLAGAATGVRALVGVIWRHRIDGISILVGSELLLSGILLVASDDPRVILPKPSFYTLAAAVYLLISVFVGRPVVYEAAAPLAIGGDPQRANAY